MELGNHNFLFLQPPFLIVGDCLFVEYHGTVKVNPHHSFRVILDDFHIAWLRIFMQHICSVYLSNPG